MGRKLADFSIANPKTMLAIIVLITVVASIGFKNAWLSTSYKAMFDADDPMLMAMNDNENTFTKTDWITVAVANPDGTIFNQSTLTAIDRITEQAWTTPFSLRVDSITNFQYVKGTDEELIVEPLLAKPAQLSQQDIERARDLLKGLPEIQGFYTGEDLSTAVINIIFELPDNPVTETLEITDYVNNLVAEVKQDHPELIFHVSGSVANTAAFTDAMFIDMGSLIPLSYAIMIGFMIFMTRSVSATVITLTVVTFASMLAMGLKSWNNGAINAINMFAPMMIMTIAIADCVHVLSSFLSYDRAGKSRAEAITLAIKDNASPVFFTSLTTVIGFLSINFHESPVYREAGNIVAVGVIMAYFLSMTMVPALTMLLPFKQQPENGTTNRLAAWMSRLVMTHHKTILIVGVVSALVLITIGVPRNEINEDFNDYLDENFAFRKANDYLNEHVTGTHRLMYSLESGSENGLHEPAFLAKTAEFVDWLRAQPEVAHVSSYTDIIKRLNQAMNSDDAGFYRIPESRELSSQYSLLYEMSLPYGQGITNIVSMDKRKTLVMVTAWTADSKTILQLNERAEQWLRDNAPEPMHVFGSGFDMMFNKMAMQNVPSMVYGSILCLLLVSIILVFVFRSWFLGLISIITNLFPALMSFGIWGFVSGRIGIGVASVATLTFGLVVDDTIHFLSKYNNARRQGLSVRKSVDKSITTVGLAMITTTLVFAAGFGILWFSHYTANSDMGFMTATTILLAVIIDLLLLPSLLVTLAGKSEDDGSTVAVDNKGDA